MMTDLAGMPGAYAPRARWASENGILGIGVYNAILGDRTVEPIELGSPEAKFAIDLLTRQKGWGLIREGFYDFKMVSVDDPWPPSPGSDFKPAYGLDGWSPRFGEVRFEANGALFRDALVGIVELALKCDEAHAGKCPVIWFTDRRERTFKVSGSKIYWAPIINLAGWYPREKTPLGVRPPTNRITGPAANAAQLPHEPLSTESNLKARLAQPVRLTRPGGQPATRRGDSPPPRKDDDLDDNIPW
jgi:hypothetical protein